MKRGQEESDLERIQDLFPNDCLRLYDKDVITMVSVFPNNISDDKDVTTVVSLFSNNVSDCTVRVLQQC